LDTKKNRGFADSFFFGKLVGSEKKESCRKRKKKEKEKKKREKEKKEKKNAYSGK
jgi:hypothetical protein